MNKDILTIYDNEGNTKDYKLLLVIDKEFKYLIYTDLDNINIKKNLYAVKIKDLNRSADTLPIDDNEWEMIEETYKKLINT